MDALKELAEMEIRADDTGGGFIDIRPIKQIRSGKFLITISKRTCKENSIDPYILARLIEQLQKMATAIMWRSDYLKYKQGQNNAIIADRMFCEVATAIRGPESETKEDRYRKALEWIANHDPRSYETSVDVAREALEAK